jgi:ankyrin repeat protein
MENNITDFDEPRKGEVPLMSAARKCHVDIVDFILSHGAKINQQDVLGTTALMFAVMSGQKDTVELLVRRGANLNVQDMFHETAVDYAVVERYWDIAMLLISNGAYVGERNLWLYDEFPASYDLQGEKDRPPPGSVS